MYSCESKIPSTWAELCPHCILSAFTSVLRAVCLWLNHQRHILMPFVPGAHNPWNSCVENDKTERGKEGSFLISAQLADHSMSRAWMFSELVGSTTLENCGGRRGFWSFPTIQQTLLIKHAGSLKGGRPGFKLISVFTSGLTQSCADVSLLQTAGRGQLSGWLSLLFVSAQWFSGCRVLLQKWLLSNMLTFLLPQTWASGRVHI